LQKGHSVAFMKKKVILFIGPIAPPYGGISIHIDRLSILLEKDFHSDYIDESKAIKQGYFNIRSLNMYVYLKKILTSDVLYIHSGNSLLRAFHVAVGSLMGRKTILTLHAYPFDKLKAVKLLEETIYGRATKIILVNENLYDKIQLPRNKCLVRNAFLPPVMQKEPSLPETVNNWLTKSRHDGKYILCANAWQLEIFNNEDLYGADLCIDVVKKLNDTQLKVSMVFNVASLDKFRDKYDSYQSIIDQLGLGDSFLLINEKMSFVKLIEKSDIVLRPTNTDGDALTIREALFLGKPVIASDVVNRPQGTCLFQNRNAEDLANKITDMINQIGNPVVKSENENGEEYHSFYKQLLDGVISHHHSR
jgi:glycosyltransferase involved in cell wall biosynthesis